MKEIFETAVRIYPCFEDEHGSLFLRFTNISVLRVGSLEFPIKPFSYDPQTMTVYTDVDGIAFEAIPTLKGLSEVIAEALQSNARLTPTTAFAWAVTAHGLKGTLTPSVMKAWIGVFRRSAWFSVKEVLLRLHYEIFEVDSALQVN
jgi:hypothetical protein